MAATENTSPAVQTTIPTLHHLQNSTSFRVLWALEEITVVNPSFRYKLKIYPRPLGPAPPELREVFPLGKSPALTLEYADPDAHKGEPLPTYQIRPGILTEARLILHFLADEYGNGIWEPNSMEERRRDVFFQTFATVSTVERAHYLMMFEVIEGQLPFGIRQLVGLLFGILKKYHRADLPPVQQLLEDELSDDKPWFAGEKFGLADLNMGYTLDLMTQRKYIDDAAYPKLMDWFARIQAREGYKRALEKGGSYNLATW